ncbi:MAG: crossover junction endodeoxyribonuclease RuvC [Rhodospirillaceae bacterium]|nr:crossover junction endodeoxyribonuclease RuvC [Rhodospirillaceae bacterium]
MSDPVRILGIDPGSRRTGYGIIDDRGTGREARLVTTGTIATTGDHNARLRRIFSGIEALVRKFGPNEVSVERVFMHRNADSALKLGQARAAALCGTFEADIPVFEYAARYVKKAVVGRGDADKAQVQLMVRVLLGLRETPAPDAADALALALCHAYVRGSPAVTELTAARS